MKYPSIENNHLKTRVIDLSAKTMQKQRRHHPDILPGDYAKVQHIVDTAQPFKEDRGTLVYVLDKPGSYCQL